MLVLVGKGMNGLCSGCSDGVCDYGQDGAVVVEMMDGNDGENYGGGKTRRWVMVVVVVQEGDELTLLDTDTHTHTLTH